MEMKIFKVAITEVYRKVVSVQARNKNEAHQRAWDAWNNTEIILDMNDFEGAEMSVLDEGKEFDGKKISQDSSFVVGKGTVKNGR